ncbi:DUF5694 domain-containing protein [soil metagenome]
MLPAPPQAGQRPGAAIDHVLAPRAKPAFQSDVLVLATTHLSNQRERLTPMHLAALLARLETFGPTRIAIEALHPDELAVLAEREQHDPAAAQLLDMFGRTTVNAGRSMQHALGVDRVSAEQQARVLLGRHGAAPTDDERLRAVAFLIAAFDFNSATLQWSYLSPAVRESAEALPPEINALLQSMLQSSNEIVTLAMPLARTLGLQLLHCIDSQYDGVRTLSAPRAALEELYSDPARSGLQDEHRQVRVDSIREAAFAAGDLLPLYLYMNSPDHQLGDLSQWNWLFQQRNSSGLDRFRYAMWELRNLRQATHIIDVAASGAAERVLVIVGASHKPYLDRVLDTQLSVRLVQLDQLRTAATAH